MKFLSFLLSPFMLCGTIFFNDNFEDRLLDGWRIKGEVQCAVDPAPNKYWLNKPINPDFIRLQYHGIVSMEIADNSISEVANAIHSFPVIPQDSEYMVEFYFHFYEKYKESFKNFYLYKPEVLIEGRRLLADILLKLGAVKGDSVALSVIDKDGLHSDVYFLKPDTIFTLDYGADFNIPQWAGIQDFPIERWYRFQIHKINTNVFLYINGVCKGLYKSISDNRGPDRFLLGMENAAFENGMGIYDDFIITTPPEGQHPRLLFNSSELPELRLRRNDNTSTIQRTYQDYWNKIILLRVLHTCAIGSGLLMSLKESHAVLRRLVYAGLSVN